MIAAVSWTSLVVGFVIFAWHVWKVLSRLGLTGKPYKGEKMDLSKAFDPAPLIAALKAKGIKDAEQLVNDELPVIFDWLNSSIAMESKAIPLLSGIAPIILSEVESVLIQKLNEFEKAIGG